MPNKVYIWENILSNNRHPGIGIVVASDVATAREILKKDLSTEYEGWRDDINNIHQVDATEPVVIDPITSEPISFHRWGPG